MFNGNDVFRDPGKMENKPGLKTIVIYSRFIGNTYLGWNFGQKLSQIKKYSLIAWNLLLLLLVSFQVYLGIQNSFLKGESVLGTFSFRPDVTKHKSGLLDILFSSLYVSYTVHSIIIIVFLAIRGPQILEVLKEVEVIEVSHKYEKKIGVALVLVNFITVFITVSIVSTVQSVIYQKNDTQVIILFVYFPIVYFLSCNSHYFIILFICYKSLIVSKQFKLVSKINDLKQIFEIVSQIQKSIEKFDSLINFFNLFELALSSLQCISSLCMLAIAPDENPVNSLSHLMLSMSKITLLCLTADIIPKQFAKLLRDLKDRLSQLNEYKSGFDQLFNHMLMNRLNETKDEMCFTAFNLFKLNANTLLNCIALIASYTIIIIQTNQSS